jgi:hypothetical protein
MSEWRCIHLDLYACVHFISWYMCLICEKKTIFIFFVERSCHIAGRRLRPSSPRRILQERSGKVAGSCRKSAEIGVSGSSIPSGNLLNFCFAYGFQWISCAFPQESVVNHRAKSEKFPVGILVPRCVDFRWFPAGTDPYFSSWGYDKV